MSGKTEGEIFGELILGVVDLAVFRILWISRTVKGFIK